MCANAHMCLHSCGFFFVCVYVCVSVGMHVPWHLNGGHRSLSLNSADRLAGP